VNNGVAAELDRWTTILIIATRIRASLCNSAQFLIMATTDRNISADADHYADNPLIQVESSKQIRRGWPAGVVAATRVVPAFAIICGQ
jgi:hypothetical protein